MRKRAGIGAIDRERLAREKFKTKGAQLANERLKLLTENIESLKTKLQIFAAKYGKSIKENPELRDAFNEMCVSVGLDPLGMSSKDASIFTQIFGNTISSFYNELAVCLATRPKNGGIIGLNALTKLVIKSRGPLASPIGPKDVLKTVDIIGKWLGNGFRIINFLNDPTTKDLNKISRNIHANTSSNESYFIQSTPGDLTIDHVTLLHLVEKKINLTLQSNETNSSAYNLNSFLSFEEISTSTGWDPERIQLALDYLIKDGVIWIDDCTENPPKEELTLNSKDKMHSSNTLYWFINFFEKSD